MRFTILSHAGLLVEHAGVRVVFDPWVLGSCYWRSWWNFPEPDSELIADLRADFVYLTHLHWDHFHGPSLQKLFSPRTRMLVPKVPTRRMLDDLRYLGFQDITEIPHGTSVALGPGFSLHSYQFGLGVDSAAVLRADGVTLFNCNDAKFFGLPLRQIMRDHPQIDFILRSHSSAGPIPYCIDDWQRLLPDVAAQSDSGDQFARCALHVRARYAIPFASNHCFLHAETLPYNGTATTPDDVSRQFAKIAERCASKSECVVMPPGSSWSKNDGFRIRPFDFAARSAYIDSMLQRHRSQLESTYRQEASAAADFGSFRAYFARMLAALPAVLRRYALPRIVFQPRDARGTHCWLVDPRRGVVKELLTAPSDCVSIEVHAAVLKDCTDRRMFSVWTASKRLKIKLPAASALSHASRWFTVLDLYELDAFPLVLNFSPRALAVRMRRWREAIELGRLIFRRLLLRRSLTVAVLYPVKTT